MFKCADSEASLLGFESTLYYYYLISYLSALGTIIRGDNAPKLFFFFLNKQATK